jgi:phosphoglycolate phosphatase
MLIFWDIDGTLLTTGRAGIYAWQDALREVTGVVANLWEFDTAGHPDFGIARRLLTQFAGVAEPEESAVARLVERYEDHLPAALSLKQGAVLPNVREILEALARDPGARSMLLTGNTHRGAQAKLAHYGLAPFFSEGAFSDGNRDRIAIARAAVDRAGMLGATTTDRVFVVGDTPHDVRCGLAIGARTIAVATGGYQAGELAAAGAWRTVPQLPPAADFFALLAGSEVAADA